MSDPIGAAVSRFTSSLTGFGGGLGPAGGQGIGDTGARQVPVFKDGGAPGTSFADSLTKAINGVSDNQDKASDTLNAFLRGDNVELHQVMAATEEAGISLQMLIEVRNKFADAYRSLTNMQG
jgi:flagellar hook-basal body complex protein FliE